jgi:quercetin dioxygenase-like cupin family protein
VKRGHRLHELSPGVLLVFKPRHHLEPRHAHDYKQRIRLLSGKLELRLGGERKLLERRRPVAAIPAGLPHRTRALEDTWLIVERIGRRENRRE